VKIFEYAVLLDPTSDEKKAGKNTEIIVPITSVLANDEQQAIMLAGRAIPDTFLDKVDRITVAVRPF